jgi:TatA/E family protein of Tat protein translocase
MLLHTPILLFFDFSGGEFLLIAVVFLLFFGSKSIPGMARALGKAVRDFKEAANTVQREISESTTVEEVKETPKTGLGSTSSFTIAPPPATISQETNLSEPSKTDSGSADDKPITE